MGTKTSFIFLIGILSFSLPLAFGDEFDDGIIASTDKPFYDTGDMLIVSGEVDERKMPVLALRVYDPYDGILSANSVELEEDNSFSKLISLDSPFYDETGTYTIKIAYGKLKQEITFDIGNPDFPDETIFDEIEETIIPEVVELKTDKLAYSDDDTITITGSVSAIEEPTTLIGIYDPFGVPAGFYFGDIDEDNEFTVSFLAKAGINFKIDGTYSIIARYGESEQIVYFDFFETQQDDVEDEIEETQNETIEDEIEELPKETIKKEIVNPTQKETPIITKTKTNYEEKDPAEDDNLTVEDVELGIILNQITLNCDQNDYSDIISYYDGMGPAMIRLCNYNAALSVLDTELKADPKNVEILSNKAAILAKIGLFDEAIIYYDSALEIDPSFIPALNNKGNVLSNLGKYAEAVPFYILAIELQPNNTIIEKNFAYTKSNIPPNQQENIQNIINENIDQKNTKVTTNNTVEIKTESNSEEPDLFEQIGNVFSSLGSIFGFQ